MSDLHAALTGAMAMVGLAKTALDARDDVKVRGALTDLTLKLNDVSISALASTEKAMTLQATIRDLESELREIKAQAEERDRYALVEIRSGAFAYRSRDDQQRPVHFLCQPCYDKGVKSVLRHHPPRQGTDERWTCPEVGAMHTISVSDSALPYPPVPPSRTFF